MYKFWKTCIIAAIFMVIFNGVMFYITKDTKFIVAGIVSVINFAILMPGAFYLQYIRPNLTNKKK